MLIVKLSTITSGLPPNVSHSISQMTFRLMPPVSALLMSGWAVSTEATLRTVGRRSLLRAAYVLLRAA